LAKSATKLPEWSYKKRPRPKPVDLLAELRREMEVKLCGVSARIANLAVGFRSVTTLEERLGQLVQTQERAIELVIRRIEHHERLLADLIRQNVKHFKLAKAGKKGKRK
jgi:hypothetical protein